MRYARKTLFILGGDYDYIRVGDLELFNKYFPNAKIKSIEGAGHYLHYTHSREFLDLAAQFISEP